MRPSQSDPLDALRYARDSAQGPLFVHYSCAVKAGDPGAKQIGFIVVHSDGSLSQTFDAMERDEDEAEMLKCFAEFVGKNVGRIWIGWRFLRSDFGFLHIAARYAAIVGEEMKLPTGIVDLKDQLKLLFGGKFADDPKLECAARINHVTMIDMLDKDATAAAFKAGDWPKLRANTERRVAMIRDLFYKAVNREFVPNNSPPAVSVNESKPNAPTGFLGGEALANALDVHATRREAFFGQLKRRRISLGNDCWHEVHNPRPNSPQFVYLAASPELLALAMAYKRPKTA